MATISLEPLQGNNLCLLEVPLQQALEGFAVAGFVAGHFIVGLRPTAGNENARSLHWNYRLSMVVGYVERLISLIF